MFAELVLPSALPVDRDEVEDAITEALGAAVEVTGAGSGIGVSNLDLELSGPKEGNALAIRAVVRGLGIQGATLRFDSHHAEHL